MKHQVSDQQIEQYQQNGFLAIEGFLDASELATWRTHVDDAVAQRLEEARRASEDWGSSATTLTNQPKSGDENFYSNVFTQCVRLADTHEGVHDLMYDERLGEAAGRLAGVDGMRIWHDQALIKRPFANATAWHLDNPYWSFTSRDSISIWVALDDATLGNGCTWYLPGTQKLARHENSAIGMNMRDIFKIYPEWETIESKAAPCPPAPPSSTTVSRLTARAPI